MQLVFEQIRTGGDRNFAYLIGDRRAKVAVAIDPSFDPGAVLERARAQGLSIETILNTHGHPDHINGNADLKRETGASIAAFKGSGIGPERELHDNDRIEVGAFALRMLHTPGHAEDHLVVALEGAPIALTGDLLFVGKVGGTADERHARVEFESLRRVFDELPDETTIWPGHDYGCRPASSLALERMMNPFIQAETIEAFLEVKATWPDLKSRNGLK